MSSARRQALVPPTSRLRRPLPLLLALLCALILVAGLPGRALGYFWDNTTAASSTLSAAPDFIDGSLYRWGSDTTPADQPAAVDTQSWNQVAVGRHHACGIKADKSLWCWGRNVSGAIGAGASNDNLVYDQTQIAPGTRWNEVAAGDNSSCAIQEDGGLWCWGDSGLGQTGQGSPSSPLTTPTRVGTESYGHVAVRQTFGCAIRTDGGLWCWGSNANGQLGQGNQVGLGPVQVAPGTVWTTVDVGWSEACAIRSSDSTLWCWGLNDRGQLGLGDTNDRYTPSQVGTSSDWVSVSADDNVCGIRTDTSLWCWGENGQGQLGLGDQTRRLTPEPVTSPTSTGWSSVVAGEGSSCALRTDKTLWCWGLNDSGRAGLGAGTVRSLVPAQVGAASNWTQVSVFEKFSCALNAGKGLWCWGLNDQGQSGRSATSPTALAASPRQWHQVAVGRSHTCAVRSDASLWCTDSNAVRQLGLGDAVSRPALTQVGSAQWRSVSAGVGQTCAIRTDDQLWCWGDEASGQLGNGQISGLADPVRIDASQTYETVSAGSGYTCGIRTDGTLWCWGANDNGQLGIGSTVAQSTPAQVGSDRWQSVSVMLNHTCGIQRPSGALYCWGANAEGQLGVGDTTDRSSPAAVDATHTYIAVTVAGQHTCAIRTSGTLYCWGANGTGQLGDGGSGRQTTPKQEATGNTTWYAVDAGYGHTCAARADRSIWCWGLNATGQLATGNHLNATSPQRITSMFSRTFAVGWFTTFAIQW